MTFTFSNVLLEGRIFISWSVHDSPESDRVAPRNNVDGTNLSAADLIRKASSKRSSLCGTLGTG